MELDIVVCRLVSGAVLYAMLVESVEHSSRGYFMIDWDVVVSSKWLNRGRSLFNSGSSYLASSAFLLLPPCGKKPRIACGYAI